VVLRYVKALRSLSKLILHPLIYTRLGFTRAQDVESLRKRSRNSASIHSTIFDISSYSQRAVSNHDSLTRTESLWFYSYCVISFQDFYFTPMSASNICGRSVVDCHYLLRTTSNISNLNVMWPSITVVDRNCIDDIWQNEGQYYD